MPSSKNVETMFVQHGEYKGIYTATPHITYFGEMSCGVCHLQVGRKNLDETIPRTQLSSNGKGCNRKVLYIQAAVEGFDVENQTIN